MSIISTPSAEPPAMVVPDSDSVAVDLFADIVFDRPLDHAYTYAVPAELADRVAVGKRVEAPFGRGDSTVIGYCVRLSHDQPARKVKKLLRVVDDEALLTDPLLRLTRWMADYYLCGWGQVLQAVLPAGVRGQAGLRESVFVEAVPESELPETRWELTKKQAAVLEKLRKEDGPIEQRRLAKVAQCSTGVIGALVDKGYARTFIEQVERLDLADGSYDVTSGPIVLNEDQQRAFEPIRQALLACQTPHPALPPQSRGEGEKALAGDKHDTEGNGSSPPPGFAGGGQGGGSSCVDVGRGFHPFLLHGVTGSGKTEIYLRAIEEVIRQGKEAIVLVPEISLTPQTIERFKGRCGEVAVLHSHLTDSERGSHWRRVAAGQVNVVVGARSAVFAPTRKLGLIVIDEEHEGTFKQESTPRYHARDVAVMRAKLENIPIVLGSATPSLESWHNAQRKAYTLLTLPIRVLDRPLPKVRLVDLRHEPKTAGPYNAISATLEKEMHAALAKGGQIMLLLNRRGFSTHVHCPSCGHVAQCQRCDLALTFHRQRASLLCHYCGFEQPPYQKCPLCGKETMRYQGLGTEKLQAEIVQKFPSKVVQRMDSDTMQRPGSHRKVLDAFRDGHVQILIGTQMIAKGLDFPNVTIVGVINADVGLHFPDFRAAERTFQLLAQVAGRTGRGERGGKVLIQTYAPEHPCIELAATHDYLAFAKLELVLRKQHLYPPYQRLVRLIIRSLKEDAAVKFAQRLASAFERAVQAPEFNPPQAPGVRILGPAEAPVYRLNNYYRQHFQLQSSSPALLHKVLRDVVATARPPHGVEFQVDVDPYNMM